MTHSFRRTPQQTGMGVCVIPNHVSGARHSARKLRSHFYKLPDQEKRRPHFMLCEHIKQMQGVRIIRSIVIGQTDLAWITAVGDGGAIELRSRTVAVVAEP